MHYKLSFCMSGVLALLIATNCRLWSHRLGLDTGGLNILQVRWNLWINSLKLLKGDAPVMMNSNTVCFSAWTCTKSFILDTKPAVLLWAPIRKQKSGCTELTQSAGDLFTIRTENKVQRF